MSAFRNVLAAQTAELAHATAQTTTAVDPPTTAEEFMGIAYKPGDRVLDIITGQEGTVNAAVVRNTVLPTS